MSVGSVDAIERGVHKTNEWIVDLTAELGHEDRNEAWRVLSAFLQVLRDRVTVDEAAQFAAQLPQVLRGAFYEGFDPGRGPDRLDAQKFLAEFADRARLAGTTDASLAAEAVMRVVRRHVSGGEIDHLLSQLPDDLGRVLAG